MKREIIFFSVIASFLFFIAPVLAQEEPSATTEQQAIAQPSEEVKLDTDIKPEDLGVSKARILPDNPFYGFKNLFRGVRETLTFDPTQKAEVQLQHVNEKLVEARQLVEGGGTSQAQEAAVRTLRDANNDFDKIAKQSQKFSGNQNFLNKIASQSLKQQVVMQKLGENVPENVFTKIEQNRQEHLEKFGQVMAGALKTPEQMRNFLPQVVENQQGSDFKELKAIEILRDLEDKVSPEQKDALRLAQRMMSQKFEQRFSNMPQEARQERVQNYVQFMPGNPVRQFEAFDTMKQNFQSPEIMQEMELAKDKAVQKFENQFGQFQGEQARQEFMAPWRNGDLEDLRTITEMGMRLEPSEGQQAPTPVFQNFQQFQRETHNNFRERFSDNPEALQDSPVFQRMAERPDIVDLKLTQDLTQIFQQSGQPSQAGPQQPSQSSQPSQQPRALNFVKQFQNQATEKFIDNIQQPGQFGGGQQQTFGPPMPSGLKVLEGLKDRLPTRAQGGIDQAIRAQTKTMETHLERINDSNTFQRYKQQIEGDQTIRGQVQRFAPNVFQQQPPRQMFQPQMPVQPGQQQSMEGGAGGQQSGGLPSRPNVPIEGGQQFEGGKPPTFQFERGQEPNQQSVGTFRPEQPQSSPQSIQQVPAVEQKTLTQPGGEFQSTSGGFQSGGTFQSAPAPAPAPAPSPVFPSLIQNFLGTVSLKLFDQ